MQEFYSVFKKIFSAEEYKIFIMQNIGFNSDEIAKENNISRKDLLSKWKKIKEKLLLRFVKKL